MVIISVERCDEAHECRLCAKACPFGLIQLCPQEFSGYEATITSRIAGHFTQLCDACGRCAKACPKGKIRVAIDKPPNWSKVTGIIEGDEGFRKYLMNYLKKQEKEG